MLHMLLLPFLPISALIIQNSLTLKDLLQYQTDVQRSFDKGNNLQYPEVSSFKILLFLKLKLYFAILFSKNPYSVDGATHLEKFITNMQRERSEVAFYIFNYGKQTLALNLSERFTTTDDALEQMPWPELNPEAADRRTRIMFSSKLRFQLRHGDFRQRISQVHLINSSINATGILQAILLYSF